MCPLGLGQGLGRRLEMDWKDKGHSLEGIESSPRLLHNYRFHIEGRARGNRLGRSRGFRWARRNRCHTLVAGE